MIKTHFEWDSKKDQENQQKHGVSFTEAQYAFADSHRIIAEDVNHSDKGNALLLFWQGKRWHYHGTLHVSQQRDSDIWSRLLAERKDDL